MFSPLPFFPCHAIFRASLSLSLSRRRILPSSRSSTEEEGRATQKKAQGKEGENQPTNHSPIFHA